MMLGGPYHVKLFETTGSAGMLERQVQVWLDTIQTEQPIVIADIRQVVFHDRLITTLLYWWEETS